MKVKKLNGRPSVMVPVDLFLELARAHSHPFPGKRFWAELDVLQTKAYRKLKESKKESKNEQT